MLQNGGTGYKFKCLINYMFEKFLVHLYNYIVRFIE